MKEVDITEVTDLTEITKVSNNLEFCRCFTRFIIVDIAHFLYTTL